MSDRIGFHYQHSDGVEAAKDFVRRLQEIRQSTPRDEPITVTVILDGENCWEHYPEGGVPFLRELYRQCTTNAAIRPVRIGEHLNSRPPRDALPRLFAGSWIHHNFAIWIGHEEDNAAWDLLHAAREMIRHKETQGGAPAEALRHAWDELFIAEGSDWFWWFGDEHSSQQDDVFDLMFRRHLQNVYSLLGVSPPPELSTPIKRKSQKARHTQPLAMLSVTVDGHENFFEWVNAGQFECRQERGTMAMAATGPMRRIYFGFDLSTLFLRIDFDRAAQVSLAVFESLTVGFEEPAGHALRIDHAAAATRSLFWRDESGEFAPAPKSISVGIDRIVEIAIPFALLGVKGSDSVSFYVDLSVSRQSRDRAPCDGVIRFTVPTEDFNARMWDV